MFKLLCYLATLHPPKQGRIWEEAGKHLPKQPSQGHRQQQPTEALVALNLRPRRKQRSNSSPLPPQATASVLIPSLLEEGRGGLARGGSAETQGRGQGRTIRAG